MRRFHSTHEPVVQFFVFQHNLLYLSVGGRQQLLILTKSCTICLQPYSLYLFVNFSHAHRTAGFSLGRSEGMDKSRLSTKQNV